MVLAVIFIWRPLIPLELVCLFEDLLKPQPNHSKTDVFYVKSLTALLSS